MTPGIDDITHYTMVVRPYHYWMHRTWHVYGLTYEDLLYKYYDYKEGIEDARAQADRWRYK